MKKVASEDEFASLLLESQKPFLDFTNNVFSSEAARDDYIRLSYTFSIESVVIMPLFLIVSRHSPENCPINNEKMKKMTLELPEKLGDLEKKHCIKRIRVLTVISSAG